MNQHVTISEFETRALGVLAIDPRFHVFPLAKNSKIPPKGFDC